MTTTKSVAIANPGAEEFATMQRLCKASVVSGLLPDEYKKGSPEQQLAKATVVALKGRELGVPMMEAFAGIHVIKGKPAISSQLMLSLIWRTHPTATIDFVKLTNTECVIEAARPGGKTTTFQFTMEDAKRAGLTGNSTWSKYPKNMCKARAISDMARTLFPDALSGCVYTPEELGAEVDEDGEIKDVTPAPKQETAEVPAFLGDEPCGVVITDKETLEEHKKQSFAERVHEEAKKVVAEQQAVRDGRTKNKDGLTQKQIKRLFAIAKGTGWSNDAIKAEMVARFGVETTKDLGRVQYEELCDYFENNEPLQDAVEEIDMALNAEPTAFESAPTNANEVPW